MTDLLKHQAQQGAHIMEATTDAKLTLKTETCPLCLGWGELEGYAGVNKMTCFKCKGTGREKIYQLSSLRCSEIKVKKM